MRLTEAEASAPEATSLRMLFAVGQALGRSSDPLNSAEWQQLIKHRAAYAEQLAVIAALAINAQILYGDRPKPVTYQRLMHLCSTADLDRSFGARASQHMCDLLERSTGQAQHRGADAADVEAVERVLMREREQVLWESAQEAAAAQESANRPIMLLVGMLQSTALDCTSKSIVVAQQDAP